MSHDLLRCKYCGSMVSRRRLQKHVARLHLSGAAAQGQGGAGVPRKPRVPESLIDDALDIADESPKKALGILKKLEERYAPDSDVCYGMGVALLFLGKLDDAAGRFREALKLDHSNKDARTSLDMTEKTIRILSPNARFSGQDASWMGSVANSARASGLFEIAIKIADKMIEIDTTGGSLNDLGLIHQDMGEYRKAIEYFDRALQIDPDMPEAISNKALCTSMIGRLDESFALYQRAIELRPAFLQGWYNLGYISMRNKKYEEALQYFDRAIELNDEYYMAWFAKSQVLIALKREEEAAKCLKEALRLNPEYTFDMLSGGKQEHTSDMHAKSAGSRPW